LSEEQLELRQVLERREREYMMGTTRFKMKTSVENLEVGDFHIDRLDEGETVDLPRWVAEEIIAKGMAEEAVAPFENEVFNALGKEKMMGPLQLSTLGRDFYVKMRRRLATMRDGVAEGRGRKEDFDKLRAGCYDLVGIRLSKLLSLSSSTAQPSSMDERLTPEEAAFFALTQSLSKEWRTGLLGVES
jgi:hypothetical protein